MFSPSCALQANATYDFPVHFSVQSPGTFIVENTRSSEGGSCSMMDSDVSFIDPNESFSHRASLAVLRRFSAPGVGGEFRQGTVMGVTLNTLCNVMGAGILSLPLAMHHASVAVGLLLLTVCVITSVAASYFVACGCEVTGRESYAEVLAYSLWPEAQRSPLPTRRQNGGVARRWSQRSSLAEAEFTSAQHERAEEETRRKSNREWMLVLMEVIVFLNNFGALIIYSRVIADSIPPVVRHFLHGDGFWTDKVTWLLLSGCVFFFLSCVRSMEELKWTSLVGFGTILFVVVIVIMRFFTMEDERPPSSSIHWVGFSTETLKAMSSYGVAFGYHYNIPYFYKELRDRSPSHFMKSVAIAFPIIYSAYAATSVLGYLTFGSSIAGSGGDVINNYPVDDTLVNVGRLGLFFHFACVFPVLSVCARRGLHRLFMIAVVRCAGIVEAVKARRSAFRDGDHRVPLSAPNESTPLIVSTGEQEVVVPSSKKSFLPITQVVQPSDALHRSDVVSPATSPTCEREADADPGRPEDTTRMAIIVEAAVIVSLTVLIAGVVTGIDVVIDVIGTLFGLTLMLIVPGAIGIKTFEMKPSLSPTATGGRHVMDCEEKREGFTYFTSSRHSFASANTVMVVLSWIVFCLGVAFVGCGFVMMIFNAAS